MQVKKGYEALNTNGSSVARSDGWPPAAARAACAAALAFLLRTKTHLDDDDGSQYDNRNPVAYPRVPAFVLAFYTYNLRIEFGNKDAIGFFNPFKRTVR